MASEPVVRPFGQHLAIPADLCEFLHLQETETHYAVRTLSGATLMRPKSEIEYPWELMMGIMDDGKDTTEEKRREREWELAHDERKFGSSETR